jgi:hypothetical protein
LYSFLWQTDIHIMQKIISKINFRENPSNCRH